MMDLFPHFPHHTTLTEPETLIWQTARNWRRPDSLTVPAPLDWSRWLEITHANKMTSLAYPILKGSVRLRRNLPDTIWDTLCSERERQEANAENMGQALCEYLEKTAARGVETVVLKGLWVSDRIYGDPAIRPGGDIDILHRRRDIPASLEILAEMGLGRHWPNLLDDAYYDRHHLHQQRCTRDLKIWFEPHWAFDHPYTLFTVDYEGIMDRTREARLLGAPVRDLSASDLLLSLTLHLVKHAVYLPQVLNRPDLPRLILADGMLMYYLDLAEVLETTGDSLDWDQVVRLARAWGAGDAVRAVLEVCRRLFDAEVPDFVLAQPPENPRGPVARATLKRMVEHELATYRGEPANSFWNFLTLPNGAFILRPIRALDALAYLFPPGDFLTRRYGVRGKRTAARHLFRAMGQFARLALDTLVYGWERYRRLKSLNQSASLFNRLEVE